MVTRTGMHTELGRIAALSRQATTVTFTGIVACQVGTAFAARTERSSLVSVGVLSNPRLLVGIAFELVVTAAVVYAPPLQDLFGTAGLTPGQLLLVAPFPVVVWGVDELARLLRRRGASAPSEQDLGPCPDAPVLVRLGT